MKADASSWTRCAQCTARASRLPGEAGFIAALVITPNNAAIWPGFAKPAAEPAVARCFTHFAISLIRSTPGAGAVHSSKSGDRHAQMRLFGNVCLIRVRAEQLSKSVTGGA